jgi:hypothetical protein
MPSGVASRHLFVYLGYSARSSRTWAGASVPQAARPSMFEIAHLGDSLAETAASDFENTRVVSATVVPSMESIRMVW